MMTLTVTKICSGCGKPFSFEIEEGKYRMKERRFCSDCREQRRIIDKGWGAKTTDIKKRKQRKKKPATISEISRFASANGISYGMAVALIDSGKLKYEPVPIQKKKKIQELKKTG